MEFMIMIFEQSILFFPFSIGIYLSYAILKTTDMTTEGSFVLGGGLFARLFTMGINPVLSFILSLFSGALAGVAVSKIQSHNKINSLIAGIIALFMLYSLNFQIMGRPNISVSEVFSKNNLLIVVLLFVFSFAWFMNSRFGLLLRAFGSNSFLLKNLGKNVENYRMLGLSLSNTLASTGGVLAALNNGFADINMGFGMTLTGISTVIIGLQLSKFFPRKKFNILWELIFCFLAVFIYFLTINFLLLISVDPIYIKFLLGLILIFLLKSKNHEKINYS